MHVSYFTLCPNGTRQMISGLCTQGGLTVLQSSTDRPAVYSQYHKHVIVHTSTSAVPHKYWRWPVHWSFHNQQAATVLTVKGRIIAATQQITLAHARYSLHFTMGRGCPSPYNCPFPRGDPGPTWILSPTRVHARNGTSITFSRYCRAHSWDRQNTDSGTSLTTGRILCFL